MGQSQHLQQLLVGNRILQINQGENIVLAIPASVCLTRADFVEPLFSSSMSVLLFQCFQFLFLLSVLPLPHIVQTDCSRDESAHGTRQCPPTPHFRNDYCPTLPTRVLFSLIFSMAALRPARRFSCQEQRSALCGWQWLVHSETSISYWPNHKLPQHRKKYGHNQSAQESQKAPATLASRHSPDSKIKALLEYIKPTQDMKTTIKSDFINKSRIWMYGGSTWWNPKKSLTSTSIDRKQNVATWNMIFLMCYKHTKRQVTTSKQANRKTSNWCEKGIRAQLSHPSPLRAKDKWKTNA